MEDQEQYKKGIQQIERKKREAKKDHQYTIGKDIQVGKTKGKQFKDPNTTKIQKKLVRKPIKNLTRQQLIQQYETLRAQLKQLSKKIDINHARLNNRQTKKVKQPDDQQTKQLKHILNEKEVIVLKNKNKKQELQKLLDSKFDIPKINQFQNQLKLLESQLNTLNVDKMALLRIKNKQQKALNSLYDPFFNQNRSQVNAQLSNLNTQNKHIKQKINRKQKQLRKMHQTYRLKHERIRDIEEKMKKRNEIIKQEQIVDLERKLEDITNQKENQMKVFEQQYKLLQSQKTQIQFQFKRNEYILAQKEKNYRLSQLKYKQVRALVQASKKKSIFFLLEISLIDQKQNKIDRKGRNQKIKPVKTKAKISNSEQSKNEFLGKEDKMSIEKQSVGVGDLQINSGSDPQYVQDFDQDE